MGSLREYFLAVTAAAVICSIVKSLPQKKGMTSELVRLIAGLFLVITVVQPISTIDLDRFSALTFHATESAAAAAEGEKLAQEAMADIIKSQSEAYILDKAELLGLEVEVDVTVNGEDLPVPVAVRISGSASPYAKARLIAILTDNLGIAKENQLWTG